MNSPEGRTRPFDSLSLRAGALASPAQEPSISDQISPNNGGRWWYYQPTADPLLTEYTFHIHIIPRDGKSYLSPGEVQQLADELNELATVLERSRNVRP